MKKQNYKHEMTKPLQEMDLQERIDNLLENGLSREMYMVPLGLVSDFSEEEIEIIFNNKTYVYFGHIYLLVVSNPHQKMHSALVETFTDSSLPVKLCVLSDWSFFVHGKFSCGHVLKRLPDLTIENYDEIHFQPLVAEVSFRTQNYVQLIIRVAELLNESTSFTYGIALKLSSRGTFHGDFYVFQRSMKSNEALQKQIKTKKPKRLPCLLIELDREVNQSLFDDLEIRLIYYREITILNYTNDFQFTLEGRYFNVPEEFVTFTVFGNTMVRLREIYEAHLLDFP